MLMLVWVEVDRTRRSKRPVVDQRADLDFEATARMSMRGGQVIRSKLTSWSQIRLASFSMLRGSTLLDGPIWYDCAMTREGVVF